jgi:tetratricopeptide (TPR) repeat protein
MRADLKLLVLGVVVLMALGGPGCGGGPVADASVEGSHLGSVDFPTSGSAEARAHFVQGVLLLHSFEYDDAQEAFAAAREVEPDFAMAYWGEAMTHNHPLWEQQDLEAAQEVLNRLGPTPEDRLAKAPTEREKDYLRALDVLYGDGTKLARDIAYQQAMVRLAERYPDDLEAAAFSALATLGTSHDQRDYRIYMRAASIAEAVFARNPNHPGAAHYLVHSFDDPVHAPLGLPAARAYAKIAPAATHALHMPSHIFTALGMWDDVVASNVDSWEASDARVKRKKLSVDQRSYHALLWLEYGYLQQGRYREAREQLSTIEADTEATGSKTTRRHLVAVLAHYRIGTRQWDGDSIEVDTTDLALSSLAIDLFTRGFSAVKTGDVAAARPLQAELNKLLDGKGAKAHEKRPLSSDVREALVLARELEAAIDLADGRASRAVETLNMATEIEDSLALSYGPPNPVKPAHEYFGEVFLDLKRPEEAAEEFKKALDRAPKRALSLLGLARAQAATGDDAGARLTYEELGRVWDQADADVPELEEVRAGSST